MPFDIAPALHRDWADRTVDLHRPVMLDEALAGLGLRSDAPLTNPVFVDATFGRGGHSRAILDGIGGNGMLHALDQDPQAVAHAREAFADASNFAIHHRNFAGIAAFAQEIGIAGRVDGVLMDLGVSSPQLDDAARGFSFSKDGPLDMRMNPQAGESAAHWLARAQEAEIADVLWRFGEERNSRRIARRIVETRKTAPIETTAQLALDPSVPTRSSATGLRPVPRSCAATEAAQSMMARTRSCSGASLSSASAAMFGCTSASAASTGAWPRSQRQVAPAASSSCCPSTGRQAASSWRQVGPVIHGSSSRTK